jgi:hypothetical protein
VNQSRFAASGWANQRYSRPWLDLAVYSKQRFDGAAPGMAESAAKVFGKDQSISHLRFVHRSAE